jgi:hypothetical protein
VDKRLLAAKIAHEPVDSIYSLIVGTSAANDPVVTALLNRLEDQQRELDDLQVSNDWHQERAEYRGWIDSRTVKDKTETRGRKNIYRPRIFAVLRDAGGIAWRSQIVAAIMQDPPPGLTPKNGPVYNAINAMVRAGLLIEMHDGSVSLSG